VQTGGADRDGGDEDSVSEQPSSDATRDRVPLFRVKICGVTSVEDARAVAAAAAAAPAGTVAVGINFVPGSPRCVGIANAASIAGSLSGTVRRVGVFAGASIAEIREALREVALDAVQLHGHLGSQDPPDLCVELGPVPVIRAVRLEKDGLASARAWIAAAVASGAAPAMAIVDASVARGTAVGSLGGSGDTVDWHALAREAPLRVPTALAGGLTPGNVAEAIAATGLAAVDTASGVESTPGRKDPSKVEAFIAAALGAFGLG